MRIVARRQHGSGSRGRAPRKATVGRRIWLDTGLPPDPPASAGCAMKVAVAIR
jgi:hypothetical protein